MNRLDHFESIAQDMLAVARPLARAHFRSALRVEHKHDRSPVTFADRAIEGAMKAVLGRAAPHHGVFGEEDGARGLDERFVWVIDPIDGTKSFVSGVPLFGTLIGLLDRGTPVLGVIDMPIMGETWIGRADGETDLNGAPCRAAAITRLEDAVLFATSPDQFQHADEAAFERLSAACLARRFGGDCYSYGLLASGHIDLILEAGLKPYDFLPVVPVVTAAGGVITDWNGRQLTLGSSGHVLAAATPELHRAALALVAGANEASERV
ncbi:MAG: histidinol phosphate phosphatase [Alphaproteobacteria bacterium HGW-Alphaproteobacteria-1]|jgi:histidinol phosphatase-like enzyme (inositol monophosphatase family)|nr:MAG: histidinol phosphate phosphatase [Alphaproteobacteria bacterium HGW-Alphaproteobacteria-1]